MDEEDKLLEEAKDSEISPNDNYVHSKRCEETFPPKLSKMQWIVLIISYIALVITSLFLADQLCFRMLPPCICCTYICFGIAIAVVLIDRTVRHDLFLHAERLEDPSEVDATIVEVDTIEPRLNGSEERPKDYNRKKRELTKEKNRLKELGERGWTEYQILSLNQLLVEFLKEDDLIGRAKSCLEDLQEYTAYSSDRHEEGHYDQWKERINKAIKKIENTQEQDKLKQDEAAEPLRGELRTLLEHIADYDLYWARSLSE